MCRVCCRVYFIARDVVVDRSLSRGRARTDSHAKSLLTCVVCKETAPEIGRDASDRVCTVHRGSRFRTATGRSAVWCAGRARGRARDLGPLAETRDGRRTPVTPRGAREGSIIHLTRVAARRRAGATGVQPESTVYRALVYGTRRLIVLFMHACVRASQERGRGGGRGCCSRPRPRPPMMSRKQRLGAPTRHARVRPLHRLGSSAAKVDLSGQRW